MYRGFLKLYPMISHSKKYNCPECDKEHSVVFEFQYGEDGDEDEVSVDCECGCGFEVTCMLDIEFNIYDPEILVSGIQSLPPVEHDIFDTTTWTQTNDPNQIKLL